MKRIKLPKRCSNPMNHNFPDMENDTKCKWCRKSIKELSEKKT